MAALPVTLMLGDRLESSFRLTPTKSRGNDATFAHGASVRVLTSALGLLLAVRALARASGDRKAIADEAESA
jgi:hypothetical protein